MIVNREIGMRTERQRVIGLDGLRWWRREGLAFSTYFKRIPILYHNKELVVTNSINSLLALNLSHPSVKPDMGRVWQRGNPT